EMREGVSLARAGLDAVRLEERFAHEVRRPPGGSGDSQVRARLAEMHRQELRVAIGHVQQARVAETRNVVELFALRTRRAYRPPCRARDREGLQELAPVQPQNSRLSAIALMPAAA